ncbi:MAG: aspartate--tRNA ligase, partial [Planctomycetes bacterium]|nr:aspartate--tRNA ligase [Planctomycetota bacterium]
MSGQDAPLHSYRTHTCGELTKEHVGQTVRLSGWVHSHRDQKHHVFLDLRDHYGLTQVACTENHVEALEAARTLKPESVVTIDGEVVARDHANPKLATGEIELVANQITIDSIVEKLPLQVKVGKDSGGGMENEELRLKWRFLDLRRERIHRNMVVRDAIIRIMRDHMHGEGFLEVQTPILTNSSPEGARDYLVPSRVHPGLFFALPQAPQQWKQLLMASGFDKYFQIAPCFRDEDARADRAPGEFYQLDMEMAYVEQEDIFGVIERLYKRLCDEEIEGAPKWKVQEYPFPRIPYWEAMDRFGSDKPDIRFALELVDLSEAFAGTEVAFFAGALEAGGRVKALRIPGGAKDGKGFHRKLEKAVKAKGYGGLPCVIYKADGSVDGTMKRALSDAEKASVKELTGSLDEGDLVLFGFGTRLAAA